MPVPLSAGVCFTTIAREATPTCGAGAKYYAGPHSEKSAPLEDRIIVAWASEPDGVAPEAIPAGLCIHLRKGLSLTLSESLLSTYPETGANLFARFGGINQSSLHAFSSAHSEQELLQAIKVLILYALDGTCPILRGKSVSRRVLENNSLLERISDFAPEAETVHLLHTLTKKPNGAFIALAQLLDFDMEKITLEFGEKRRQKVGSAIAKMVVKDTRRKALRHWEAWQDDLRRVVPARGLDNLQHICATTGKSLTILPQWVRDPQHAAYRVRNPKKVEAALQAMHNILSAPLDAATIIEQLAPYAPYVGYLEDGPRERLTSIIIEKIRVCKTIQEHELTLLARLIGLDAIIEDFHTELFSHEATEGPIRTFCNLATQECSDLHQTFSIIDSCSRILEQNKPKLSNLFSRAKMYRTQRCVCVIMHALAEHGSEPVCRKVAEKSDLLFEMLSPEYSHASAILASLAHNSELILSRVKGSIDSLVSNLKPGDYTVGAQEASRLAELVEYGPPSIRTYIAHKHGELLAQTIGELSLPTSNMFKTIPLVACLPQPRIEPSPQYLLAVANHLNNSGSPSHELSVAAALEALQTPLPYCVCDSIRLDRLSGQCIYHLLLDHLHSGLRGERRKVIHITRYLAKVEAGKNGPLPPHFIDRLVELACRGDYGECPAVILHQTPEGPSEEHIPRLLKALTERVPGSDHIARYLRKEPHPTAPTFTRSAHNLDDGRFLGHLDMIARILCFKGTVGRFAMRIFKDLSSQSINIPHVAPFVPVIANEIYSEDKHKIANAGLCLLNCAKGGHAETVAQYIPTLVNEVVYGDEQIVWCILYLAENGFFFRGERTDTRPTCSRGGASCFAYLSPFLI